MILYLTTYVHINIMRINYRIYYLGGEVIIDTKKLVKDDIIVLRELLIRVTEVQIINIFNSSVDDETFAIIMEVTIYNY